MLANCYVVHFFQWVVSNTQTVLQHEAGDLLEIE